MDYILTADNLEVRTTRERQPVVVVFLGLGYPIQYHPLFFLIPSTFLWISWFPFPSPLNRISLCMCICTWSGFFKMFWVVIISQTSFAFAGLRKKAFWSSMYAVCNRAVTDKPSTYHQSIQLGGFQPWHHGKTPKPLIPKYRYRSKDLSNSSCPLRCSEIHVSHPLLPVPIDLPNLILR